MDKQDPWNGQGSSSRSTLSGQLILTTFHRQFTREIIAAVGHSYFKRWHCCILQSEDALGMWGCKGPVGRPTSSGPQILERNLPELLG